MSFSVLADQEVPRDAVVSVRYADLLGNRYLAVEPGGGGAALPPGATIPAERTRPALDLTALLNGFKPLFEVIDPNEVNTLANQLIAVFQGNSATVGDLLHRIVALTAALTERDQVIADTLANLNEVLDTVNG
ncbi:MCE family protein, partial [Klebsiella pneumoniae]|nr:MCE family protein [Klebsiella pneumoniae]